MVPETAPAMMPWPGVAGWLEAEMLANKALVEIYNLQA